MPNRSLVGNCCFGLLCLRRHTQLPLNCRSTATQLLPQLPLNCLNCPLNFVINCLNYCSTSLNYHSTATQLTSLRRATAAASLVSCSVRSPSLTAAHSSLSLSPSSTLARLPPPSIARLNRRSFTPVIPPACSPQRIQRCSCPLPATQLSRRERRNKSQSAVSLPPSLLFTSLSLPCPHLLLLLSFLAVVVAEVVKMVGIAVLAAEARRFCWLLAECAVQEQRGSGRGRLGRLCDPCDDYGKVDTPVS